MAATQNAFAYFNRSALEIKAGSTDGIAKARTAADKEVNVSVEAEATRISLTAVWAGSIRKGANVQNFGDYGKRYKRSAVVIEEYLGTGEKRSTPPSRCRVAGDRMAGQAPAAAKLPRRMLLAGVA